MLRQFPQPDLETVRGVVERHLPESADSPPAFLEAGGDSYVFAAGYHILRFARHEEASRWQPVEARMLQAIAPLLPVRVPQIVLLPVDGFGGQTVTAYRRIPGRVLRDFGPRPSPRLGRQLGLFLRALHSLPMDLLDATGFPGSDDNPWRASPALLYDQARQKLVPLLDAEAGARLSHRFEAFLGREVDRFQPVLVHNDLYPEHLLVDPQTEELTGVIDFGDATIGDPAADFVGVYEDALQPVLTAPGVMALVAAYGPVTGFAGRARFHHFLAAHVRPCLWACLLEGSETLEAKLQRLTAELAKPS